MNLTINGENQVFSAETLAALVEGLGMKPDRVAVELNCEIVPRDQWPQTPLRDGDRLEIVHFVGGGSLKGTKEECLSVMRFRNGIPEDVPRLCALERTPEFSDFIGSWSEAQHLRTLADPDSHYAIAEDEQKEIVGFAILLGFQSEHKSIELKRIVVSVPNAGIGRKLLEVVAHKVFAEHCAHRLWLDVFLTNSRARHVYKSFGFREDGVLREAVLASGTYHSLSLMSMLEDEYQRP